MKDHTGTSSNTGTDTGTFTGTGADTGSGTATGTSRDTGTGNGTSSATGTGNITDTGPHPSLSVLQLDSPRVRPWSTAAPEEDIYQPGIFPSPPPSPLTLPPVNFQPRPAYSSVNDM